MRSVKYIVLLCISVCIGMQSAYAQNPMAGAPDNVDLSVLNTQGPTFSHGILAEDGSTFSTTVFTFNDIILFSYFNDTELLIQNSFGDTVYTDTLAANTFHVESVPQGIYSIEGSKSYTALIGDAVTNTVQGYFAIDQSGRGTSTLFNTYMMDQEWGPERFIVFAYQDDTNFSIKNLEDNTILFAGTLNKGEHYTMPQTPYDTFLQVSANKPVSALSYGDQDYYVPSETGLFSGTLFYGFSGYIGSWTNSITVTSYQDDNPVLIKNTTTGDTLAVDTLDAGQVITHPINEETYWSVESEKTVTSANIPYAGWTGNYAYMTRAIDETGVGAGKLFYVPTIASRVDVFSFEDENDVTITHLGLNTDYPYTSGTQDTVFEGTMNAGDGYNFFSLSGNRVYRVEGTGNVSVVQSNGGFGAEFMPLSFAQALPDLAINEEGLSFDPPDSVYSTGDQVTVTLTVYNYGPIDAENVVVKLYDGDISNEGTAPVIGSETIPFIAGQDSAQISTEFIVPTDPEFRTMSLVVDPDDEIQESNSSNNTIIRPLVPNKDLLPPLPVSITAPSGLEIEEDTLAPNPFLVTADIFNEGTVPAENVTVSLVLFDGLTLTEGSADTTIASLEGQGSASLTWKLHADKDSSGTNRFTLQIDADNAEAKEINRSVYIPDIVPPEIPSGLNVQKSGDSNTDVILTWTANTEQDLAGYEIHYGTESGTYDGTEADQGTSPILISTFTEFELTGLVDTATYYFALRAFDGSNNFSDFSDEVEIQLATSLVEDAPIPDKFDLSQNYPNPFNPATKIQYSIPVHTNVQLVVYDLLGREISTLVNEVKQAGTYQVSFNMENYSSGIYIYRLKAGSFTQTRKLTLLK